MITEGCVSEMFSNCCGCDKRTMKNSGMDAVFVANNECSKTNNGVKELPILEKIESSLKKDSQMPSKLAELNAAVVEEPKKATENNQRQSVVSDIKIEISDNDDDEVFCEGVGPPVKLADNLGTPHCKVNGRSSLPRWFSEEDDDQEVGGIQEPPATPIGRDELALRRHRLFSELLNAAQSQNTTEHRVRFDPLGPVVAGDGGEHHLNNYKCLADFTRHSLKNMFLKKGIPAFFVVSFKYTPFCTSWYRLYLLLRESECFTEVACNKS